MSEKWKIVEIQVKGENEAQYFHVNELLWNPTLEDCFLDCIRGLYPDLDDQDFEIRTMGG